MKPKNIQNIYELTPMQQGLLFHVLYDQNSSVYLSQDGATLSGEMNVNAMKLAWQKLIERHSVLRTSFHWENLKKQVQVVHKSVELPWEEKDWRSLSSSQQEKELEAFLEADRNKGFDLAKPPLMRLALIRVAEKTYKLILTKHHLLFDGWSLMLVYKEVFDCYQALSSGEELNLKPSLDFHSYVTWLQKQNLTAAEAFWRKKVKGFTAPTFITNKNRIKPATAEGENYQERKTYLSAAKLSEIQDFARKNRLTLSTILLGAWSLLLSRYSGEFDVVFGVTSSGRPPGLLGVESMVGPFINTLPMRAETRPNFRIISWLQTIQKCFVEMREYEYYPLWEIQRLSDLKPGVSLFESIVFFQNYPVELSGKTLGDLQIENIFGFGKVHYPLSLIADAKMGLKIEYDRRIFDDAAIEKMLAHLETLLIEIAANPQGQIGDISMLTEVELNLFEEWNNTDVNYPQDKCVHQLFAEQVAKTPDAVAVEFEEQKLTYRQLNQRADELANYLQALGVGPEVLVGICVERSLEMVIGLLGVLKAGGAYVPIDPAYPEERIALMLSDSGASVLLTQEKLAATLPKHDARTVYLDRNLPETSPAAAPTPPAPENLAYVIYTSGSTGKPKGVQISHRALVNFLASMQQTPGIAANDVLLAVTTISFDIAGLELYLPLTVGARVVLASRTAASDGTQLAEKISASGATVMQATPATWRLLLASGWRGSKNLKILCGGEALPVDLAEELLSRGGSVWNLYGPTETTIWSAVCEVDAQKLEGSSVPVGRPIANTQIYLLDNSQNLVPVGVPGEIYIGGDGLARGYLNRPELTAEKFVANPFNGGGKLYKTGDLARYLPDGKVEYIGRIDNQVKLRGHRIELGEIEALSNQHPGVRQAVVVAREDLPGDKRLVAYIIASETPSSSDELRSWLKEKLPQYAIPSAFVFLDSFPLTPNGKIDRKSLPAPEVAPKENSRPRTPVEELVAGVWQDVLGLAAVGREDNFFELGGHSLLATRVVSRLRQAFSAELPLRTLFERPTLAEFAAELATLGKANLPKIEPVSRDRPLPLSFAQQRLWFLHQLNPGDASYNLVGGVRLTGKLDVKALEQSFGEIARRHEILRTSFAVANEQPVQVIDKISNASPTITDLREVPPKERDAEVKRLIDKEVGQPFDLTQTPLWRVALFQLDDCEHILVVTMHHIVADGWSMGVWIREFAALYNGYSCKERTPLPELTIQYADFASWQYRYLRGEVLENLLSYWRQQLAGAPATLELPMMRSRPAVPSKESRVESFGVPPATAEKLQALSRREGVTMFMTLLAALQTLLHRYTNSDDIVVGTDVANRNRAETEPLIGFFVNLLVLRTNFAGNPTFKELLKRVREVALGAYAHQDLPFAKLVEALRPERKENATPLFQVLFVFQNAPMPAVELANLAIAPLELHAETAKFDLAIFVEETAAGIVWKLRYGTDIFEEEAIAKISRNLQTLLNSIANNPDTQIKDLEMLTESEKQAQITAKNKRAKANFKKFQSIKPKAVSLPPEELVKTSFLQPELAFPFVVEPNSKEIDLADWAANSRGFLQEKLLKHGAILFRSFNINSISEFERTADAISPNLFGEYGDLPREGVSEKVYGSTPYPADKTILFHNESSHLHRWPMKIFFLCAKAAKEGGETPIVDCRKVYQQLNPKLREKLEEKQLMYVRTFIEDLDVSWQSFFRTEKKSEVENYCQKAGIEFEWLENNGLKTRKVRQAIATHPATGEKVFFNQLQLHHISCLDASVRESLLSEFGEDKLPRNVYYGDGTAIEDSVMEEINEVYWQNSIAFPWQDGNMIMLDNMLVAHARNPYVGPRKIVVAMAELTSNN